MSNIAEMSEADAWKLMKEAADERDVGDFKEALKILSKANPKLTYVDIEAECRRRDLDIHLIGLKKDVDAAYTNTNLQGDVAQTYTVGFFFSSKCPRPILMPNWPKDAHENEARLADAGIPLERGVIVCGNCGEAGHGRKACEKDREAPEAMKVICALCNEEGHRVRDCTQERKKPRAPRACKICESGDHLAADCPDKPKMICHKCEQEGHRSSECEKYLVPLPFRLPTILTITVNPSSDAPTVKSSATNGRIALSPRIGPRSSVAVSQPCPPSSPRSGSS